MPKRWDIDRTYVMSDLHFFHENILNKASHIIIIKLI